MVEYKENNVALFVNEPKVKMAGFVQLPNKVLSDKGLSNNEKIMYATIVRLSGNKRGYCFASNTYLAEFLNTSVRSVGTWIKKLKDCNYVSVEYIYQAESKRIKQRFITANISVGGGSNELTDPRLAEGYDNFVKEEFNDKI